MREFDLQLLRLKEIVGVTEDQAIASLLGLSKHAFSDRKKRGSFPVDKVLALKASMPDLNVEYILTGNPAALVAESLRKAREELVAEFGVKESSAPYGDERVAELVKNFTALDEGSKTAVEMMVNALKNKGD